MSHQLHLRVKRAHQNDAKNFLEFLRAVGRKYPVNFSYRNGGYGKLRVTFERDSIARLDDLMQELLLNRGLYYYFLSIRSPIRIKILSEVILPIFQKLVESYYRVPCSGFLRRHILGRLPQGEFIPGEVGQPIPHEFETLFRRWEIGITDDWNFIKDADAIVTKFLLQQLAHVPGTKSPNFPSLLHQASAKGLGMHKDVRKTMQQIHDARAGGLHRLQSSFPQEQLKPLATRLYTYFQYFDDFYNSQMVESVRAHRRNRQRIRYGDETWPDSVGSETRWKDFTKNRPCGDCFAIQGQYHCEGCDIEQCPKCGGQLLGCGVVELPY